MAGELAIAVALAVTAFVAGSWMVDRFRASGGVQDFYQLEFGPAVLLACGHGYRNPSLEAIPDLLAFLHLNVDRFDCARLPDPVPVSGELNAFHRTSRYLESTVALFWRLTGISWSGLVWLGGLLYASVVCLIYGIARLKLSPAWALVVVAAAATSPLNLSLLPHYRDYAKAPFMLAMTLLMAWLAMRITRTPQLFALAAGGGVVGGLGLGFRNDLLLTLPPFLVTLAVFTPPTLSRVWLGRGLAVAIFAAAFLAAARPVLADYAQGSNTGHVILLGLTRPFDERLGVERSVYDFGFGYSDSLVNATINSFARRSGRWPEGVMFGTAAYDQAAIEYLKAIAIRFPADALTRTIAAIRGVLMLPLQNYQSAPSWLRSRWVDRIYRVRGMVSSRIAPLGVIAVAAAIVVSSARSLRVALFTTFVFLVFVGGAAIQFNERHFFHLELIPWFALAVVLQWTVRRLRRGRQIEAPRPHGLLRAAGFATAMAAAAGAAVLLSRFYQEHQVRSLVESYAAATMETVPLAFEPLGEGRVRAAWIGGNGGSSPDALHTSFAVAEFHRDTCAVERLPVTLRYAPAPANDFSHDVDVAITGAGTAPARVFFPVYDRGEIIRFRGIELQESAVSCLAGIRRAAEPRLPVLLDVSLAPDWRQQDLHQKLRF